IRRASWPILVGRHYPTLHLPAARFLRRWRAEKIRRVVAEQDDDLAGGDGAGIDLQERASRTG
ncbi:MAG TPA: hypothetical protein VFI42_02640, partial [Thermomicrobiaceae bacterium]|nr:hypothetical protein [Thermomicrobiaceae bacterium]